MNNSICTLFDNILIDIHKFKSLLYVRGNFKVNDTKQLRECSLLGKKESVTTGVITLEHHSIILLKFQYSCFYFFFVRIFYVPQSIQER